MKSLPSVVLLGLLSLLGISCIKENREECPCYLIVDFSELDSAKFESVGLDVLSADGFLYSDEVNSFVSDYTVKVPRRGICVNAYIGAEFDPERGFVVAPGAGFPELWLHSSEFDTSCDVVRDTVILHKSYSKINIHMLSDGTPCPFAIGIDGDVCGYSLSGQPEDGVFKVSLQPDSKGDCYVCLPRQKSPSLALSIVDDGDVLRRFALGQYIVSSGFDWSREDLEDIDVTIDFSRTEITFRLRNWETTYCYTVEI